MKNKATLLIFRIGIILFALVGIVLCAFYYPFIIGVTSRTTLPDMTDSVNVEFYAQLIFYWLASLPCFAILVIAWHISSSIKSNDMFSLKNVRLLKLSATILLADLCAFLIGNLFFFFLGYNDFAVVYFLISVIGLAIAALLFVASHYVEKATAMKTEVAFMI